MSGWIRDSVGFMWEERPGSSCRGERKDLGRCWRGAEVVYVPKHADGFFQIVMPQQLGEITYLFAFESLGAANFSGS